MEPTILGLAVGLASPRRDMTALRDSGRAIHLTWEPGPPVKPETWAPGADDSMKRVETRPW